MYRLVGFRKFLVMLLFLSVLSAFRYIDLINGAEFAENLRIAVVAFFGANLTEHIKDAVVKYIEGKVKP